MMPLLSDNAAQTRAIGERLAKTLQPGDVLLLFGDMGVGKSELTRGIAGGLGISGVVPSPSFTILQVYDTGRLPLYHFDWFRVSGVNELYERLLIEYLYGDGVAVVEWPERSVEAWPAAYLRVEMARTGENGRKIEMEPVGGFRELDPFMETGTQLGI